MLRGRSKRQDDLAFGVVQVVGILVVFYFACSRGREIVAGVAFLVFNLILFVLAGGLILFLVRRCLPGKSKAGSRSSTEFIPRPASPDPKTVRIPRTLRHRNLAITKL
jgi:hypothetical protein